MIDGCGEDIPPSLSLSYLIHNAHNTDPIYGIKSDTGRYTIQKLSYRDSNKRLGFGLFDDQDIFVRDVPSPLTSNFRMDT